jgi:hypothetical protein
VGKFNKKERLVRIAEYLLASQISLGLLKLVFHQN